MTIDLEKIKEKIRALKRLATNDAAAVGEVANAMKAALALANQYNLKLAEIDETEQIKEIKQSIENRKFEVKHPRVNAAVSMNTRIARFYECELIYNYDNSEATIVGTQSDIDLSLYAIDISHNAMDAAWQKYMHTDEYEDYRYDGYSRSQIRRDFNKGYALQIIDLVKAMQADKDALRVQTSSCTALIVRKQHEVSTEYKRLFPNAKSSTSRISTLLTGAVNAGREEGSKVRFNQGINQNVDNTEKIGVRN